MYAKLFTSIYQGTLRGNSHGLLVFTNLLAHADQLGVVDIHPRAISEEVGIPIESVKAALEVLEAPDIESRSPEAEGRRLVRLDEHRAWGWRIVNYVKYRSIRNEEDRREQNRIAQAKWRERKQSKPRKPESAHTEAEADTEAKKEVPTVLVAKGDAYAVPNCPFQDLQDLYHEKCPSLPKMRIMTNMRMKHARARWVQVCAAEKWGGREAMDWFGWFFETVEKNDFLTGRRGSKDRPWKADFEWLMTAGNFAKVVEGRYVQEKA